MKAQLKNETKVITGKVRASYAHILNRTVWMKAHQKIFGFTYYS